MKLDIEKINKINELKALRKLRNKDEYKKLKQSLAKEFGVTLRTIENYLNQSEPGQRKTRSDAGQPRAQISDKEKQITKEILTGGKEIKLAKKTIEEKTGKKVSNRKLNHIRDKVENEISPLPNEENIKESTFGDEAKSIFEKLFELDLIAPNYGIPVNVNGKKIIIPKYYVETKWSAEDTIKFCYKIIEKFGYDESELIVEFR